VQKAEPQLANAVAGTTHAAAMAIAEIVGFIFIPYQGPALVYVRKNLISR
jgi:hypothetical protein